MKTDRILERGCRLGRGFQCQRLSGAVAQAVSELRLAGVTMDHTRLCSVPTRTRPPAVRDVATEPLSPLQDHDQPDHSKVAFGLAAIISTEIAVKIILLCVRVRRWGLPTEDIDRGEEHSITDNRSPGA